MTDTVGNILEKCRSELNLTLEEIASATHIRLYYLEALENDQKDKLPSGVQARGFLRNYADFLGIPADPLLNLWEGKSPGESLHSPLSATHEPPPQPPPQPSSDESELTNNHHIFQGNDSDSESNINIESTTAQLPVDTQDAQYLFKEIGYLLQKQRESLGLTLNDIEHYTHVKLHYLKHLEEGKFNDLPSLVQARGMLNNYARFLEVDANHVLSIFADALQLQFSQKTPPKPAPRLTSKQLLSPAPAWRRFITTDLLIGSGVIILLLTFAIWAVLQVSSVKSGQVFQTAPPFSQNFSSTIIVSGGLDALNPTKPISSQGNLELGEGSNLLAEQNPETTSTLPVSKTGRLNVHIVSRQRTYLKITVDGKVEFDGRTLSGNAYPFSGNDKIELVTGNAAALQVIFNQDDLGTMGAVGQVVRLIFTINGAITPTPGITSTPTQRPAPTITIEPTATQAKPSVTPFVP
jgi:cytoskeleton protein RodZ